MLVGDTGLFSVVDGPASSWNCFHGLVSCSPCLRAYVALYFPPVGLYGSHSLGGGRGGGCSTGGDGSSMGLSESGSGFVSSSMGSPGTAEVGSTYNSIEECSCLCSWLQRRGERARCNGEGGLGGLGRGRGRGSAIGDQGGDGVCMGDRGSATSGTWGCDSCGKADGKMMAWLLVNGAGVVDGAGANDKEGNENEGE